MWVGWVWSAVAAWVMVIWACWRRFRRWAPAGGGGLVRKLVDLSGDVAFEAADDLLRVLPSVCRFLYVCDGAGSWRIRLVAMRHRALLGCVSSSRPSRP